MKTASISGRMLNSGRFYHKDSVASVAYMLEKEVEALFAQDLYRYVVENRAFKERWKSLIFHAMGIHYKTGALEEEVGLAIMTDLDVRISAALAYLGYVYPVRKLDGIIMSPDGNANAGDISKLRRTESHFLQLGELVKNGVPIRFFHLHGPWRARGGIDDELRGDWEQAIAILKEFPGDYVLLGDFNRARGDEIYLRLIEELKLKDCMPPEVHSTRDWAMSGKEGPDLVVDHIFTHGSSISISNVTVRRKVSDHAGIDFIASRTIDIPDRLAA